MIIPDVNLLIYAHNDRAPHHVQAREWWEALLNGKTPVGLTWITIGGFIRLMTHPRILANPLDVPSTIRHVRAWLAQPPVRIVQPATKFEQLAVLDKLDAVFWIAFLTAPIAGGEEPPRALILFRDDNPKSPRDAHEPRMPPY